MKAAWFFILVALSLFVSAFIWPMEIMDWAHQRGWNPGLVMGGVFASSLACAFIAHSLMPKPPRRRGFLAEQDHRSGLGFIVVGAIIFVLVVLCYALNGGGYSLFYGCGALVGFIVIAIGWYKREPN